MAEKTEKQDNPNVPPSLVDGDAFSGIAKVVYDEPESETTLYRVPFLNALFALSSLLLLILTVWAIWQDYDREWKQYQYDWQEYKAGQVEKQIEEEEQRIAAAVEELEAKREEAESEISKRELRRKQRRAEQFENEASLAETRVKFHKSEIAARRFEFEEMRKHVIFERGGLTSTAQAELDRLESEFNEKLIHPLEVYEREAQELRVRADAAKLEVQKLIEKRDDLEKSIAATTRELEIMRVNLADLEANAVNTIRNLPILDWFAPSAQIQKVVLSDLTEPLNFMDVGRVDRCKSCHVNIDEPDLSVAGIEMDAPHGGRVYRSHPRLDLYVGSNSPHPYQEFGCTICHYGDGHSLTFFTSAHTPRNEEQKREWEEKYHWHKMHHQDYPMLPMNHIYSTCAKCHAEESRVPGAQVYNLGRDLVDDYGCYGCHKIEGFEDYRRAGPDLTYIAQKANRDFLVKWIRKPSDFRPSTRMPQFFDLDNQRGSIEVIGLEGQPTVQDFARRNGVEALAIATYVHATSRQRDDLRPLSNLRGDPARGRIVFFESGCLGCHPIEREGWLENNHGPDLSTVGSKLNRRWLADWIVDPKKHFPATRMPRLRIEQDENGEQKLADLVEYLMSLEDPEFARTPPTRIDEQNRKILREIAYDYYTRSMTRTDAVAKIEEQYEPAGLNGESDPELARIKGDETLLTYVGEQLIRRYGCFGCHDGMAGFEGAQTIGTELTKHGVKAVDRLDFAQWGHQPNGEYAVPHSRIGWFQKKLENTRIFDTIPVRKVDAEGNAIYEPSNKRVQKTAEELLKMPLFPFHDEPEKVEAVVTFLLSRLPDPIPQHKRKVLRGDEKELEAGRRIARELNCHGCHRIGADEKHVVVGERTGDAKADFPRFSFADTAENLLIQNEIERETWLADDLQLGDLVIPAHTMISRTFKTDGPRGEEEYSVVEIAENFWKKHNVPIRSRVLAVNGYDEGRMRNYFGTNPADRTKAAPLLRLQGERVNGEWLFDFLLNVEPLRPWLSLRMPSFDLTPEQSSALVTTFKTLSNTEHPFERFEEHIIDPALAAAGREIFSVPQAADARKTPPPARLGCQACHPRGEVQPTNPDPTNWGPDLSLARARLRPTWVHSWFLDPQYFMPGTNMPNFWIQYDVWEDASKNPPDLQAWIEKHMPALKSSGMQIVREDYKHEIDALLQYLMHMREVDGS